MLLHGQSLSRVCNPVDCSPPGSSVHGISQARVLEWAATSSSRGSSQPRDRTHVFCISCISMWILYHCAKGSLPQFPGKPHSRHPSSCSPEQPSRRLLSTPDVIPVVRFLLLVRFSLCEVDGICFTPSLIFPHPCLEAVSETCIQTLLMDFCVSHWDRRVMDPRSFYLPEWHFPRFTEEAVKNTNKENKKWKHIHVFENKHSDTWGSPGGTSGKEPAYQRGRHKRRKFDPWVGKIPLQVAMATHFSILAWRLPRTEEPGGLQSTESLRTHIQTYMCSPVCHSTHTHRIIQLCKYTCRH